MKKKYIKHKNLVQNADFGSAQVYYSMVVLSQEIWLPEHFLVFFKHNSATVKPA